VKCIKRDMNQLAVTPAFRFLPSGELIDSCEKKEKNHKKRSRKNCGQKQPKKGLWELRANLEGDVPLCMAAALVGACFLGTTMGGRTCAGYGILRHLSRAAAVIHDNKVVIVGSARPFFDVVSCRWFAMPTSNFGLHPDVHIAFEPIPLGSSLSCTLLNTKRTTVGIKIDMQNKHRTIKKPSNKRAIL
jgi:hypothetical protein